MSAILETKSVPVPIKLYIYMKIESIKLQTRFCSKVFQMLLNEKGHKFIISLK